MPEVQGFDAAVQTFGLAGALLLVFSVLLAKGIWIVPRYVLDQEIERRKASDERLDRALGLAENATNNIAEPAVRKVTTRR